MIIMDEKPGRNDPCPCGSGKKYKKCCLNLSMEPDPARKIREDLQDILKDQEFTSLDEANSYIRQYMEKRNSVPLAEFHGLSSHQIHRLLHFPFESPEVIQFNFDNAVTRPEDAPLTRLLSLMVDAIRENRLKPTATGNLPRDVSREIAQQYLTPERYKYLTQRGEFRSENDIPDLQVVRFVSEMAGYIGKYKGRFVVKQKCRKLLESNEWAQIYETLFKTFVRRCNWGYNNRFPEVPFFRESFGFTLFLLHKYGNISHSTNFYADNVIAAFPVLFHDVPESESELYKHVLNGSYISQVIYTFGEIAGVLRAEYRLGQYGVEAQPLLKRLVIFN